MFPFEEDAMLVQDREDLIAVLRMRFGTIPPKVVESIYKIDQLDTLQSLILAASNVPEWQLFLDELHMNEEAFRLTGERFNPIAEVRKAGESNGL